MIIESRKCDGCGETIEPADGESNTTEERVAYMYKRVTLVEQADVRHSVGTDSERYGALTIDVCARCAETRTIASFRVPRPSA